MFSHEREREIGISKNGNQNIKYHRPFFHISRRASLTVDAQLQITATVAESFSIQILTFIVVAEARVLRARGLLLRHIHTPDAGVLPDAGRFSEGFKIATRVRHS